MSAFLLIFSVGCISRENEANLDGPVPSIFVTTVNPNVGERIIIRCEGSFIKSGITTCNWTITNDSGEVIYYNENDEFFYTFNETGNFNVALLVIDEKGLSGRAYQKITVIESK
jgi:hypothetical protein